MMPAPVPESSGSVRQPLAGKVFICGGINKDSKFAADELVIVRIPLLAASR